MRVLEQAPSTPSTGAPPAVFLAGIGGVPRWLPFLDRLSETRRVVVPSLPGFPGSEAFRHLDSVYDWIVDTVEMFEALDLPAMDLVGSSVGGALAARNAHHQPARPPLLHGAVEQMPWRTARGFDRPQRCGRAGEQVSGGHADPPVPEVEGEQHVAIGGGGQFRPPAPHSGVSCIA